MKLRYSLRSLICVIIILGTLIGLVVRKIQTYRLLKDHVKKEYLVQVWEAGWFVDGWNTTIREQYPLSKGIVIPSHSNGGNPKSFEDGYYLDLKWNLSKNVTNVPKKLHNSKQFATTEIIKVRIEWPSPGSYELKPIQIYDYGNKGNREFINFLRGNYLLPKWPVQINTVKNEGSEVSASLPRA